MRKGLKLISYTQSQTRSNYARWTNSGIMRTKEDTMSEGDAGLCPSAVGFRTDRRAKHFGCMLRMSFRICRLRFGFGTFGSLSSNC